MKRIGLLCLALLLLLCGCAQTMQLEKTKEGYTDKRSGASYVALDPAYQPTARGDAVAEYNNADRGIKRVFYEIPGLNVAQYLADEYGNVYCSDEVLPDAALWQLTAALVCEEESISVERCRISEGDDDTELALLKSLWFEGASDAVLPILAPKYTFQIKLCGKEYSMLYYNFSMQIYENGEIYFYDAVSGRTVEVPRILAVKLCPEGTLPAEVL